MSGPTIVCVPVQPDGHLDPRWGKAAQVAIARVDGGVVASWQVITVGWDALHDTGTEGGHHARVARFLAEHNVGAVVANHMGPPMQHMLEQMGLAVHLGAAGDARQATLLALTSPAGSARPD